MACDGVGSRAGQVRRRATCHMPRRADVVDRRSRSATQPASADAPLRRRSRRSCKKSPAERMAYWTAELEPLREVLRLPPGLPAVLLRAVHRRQEPARPSSTRRPTLKGNFAWHITRAFHLAGRCVGCDECTRACPAGIDLRLLNLSLAKAAEEQFRLSRRAWTARPSRSSARYSQQDKEEFHPMSELISRASAAATGRTTGSARASASPARVPVKPDLVLYTPAGRRPTSLLLDGFVRPANSIKEFVFPRHEKLYGYRFEGKQIELADADAADRRADHHRRPALRRRRAADPRPRVQLGLRTTSSTTAAAS